MSGIFSRLLIDCISDYFSIECEFQFQLGFERDDDFQRRGDRWGVVSDSKT